MSVIRRRAPLSRVVAVAVAYMWVCAIGAAAFRRAPLVQWGLVEAPAAARHAGDGGNTVDSPSAPPGRGKVRLFADIRRSSSDVVNDDVSSGWGAEASEWACDGFDDNGNPYNVSEAAVREYRRHVLDWDRAPSFTDFRRRYMSKYVAAKADENDTGSIFDERNTPQELAAGLQSLDEADYLKESRPGTVSVRPEDHPVARRSSKLGGGEPTGGGDATTASQLRTVASSPGALGPAAAAADPAAAKKARAPLWSDYVNRIPAWPYEAPPPGTNIRTLPIKTSKHGLEFRQLYEGGPMAVDDDTFERERARWDEQELKEYKRTHYLYYDVPEELKDDEGWLPEYEGAHGDDDKHPNVTGRKQAP
eukprot:GHVU01197293.1.p1 GENE.GHVU01197293.1~~GHVU01197293.1.p1  ORF type:complete len:363 (-),score=80.40 GHVU01197293.1:1100-2188(-)